MNNNRWFYIIALLLLPCIRVLVLDLPTDQWVASMGYQQLATTLQLLKANGVFIAYMGNWALPVFVVIAMLFWLSDDSMEVPKHFLLVPIAYVPFSIVGTVLMTAEFRFDYLYVHPLVIIPVGYIYVTIWVLLAWILRKIKVLQ